MYGNILSANAHARPLPPARLGAMITTDAPAASVHAAGSAVKAAFDRDGCLIHPHPVLAAEQISRAARALYDIRDGRFETGRPPPDSNWKPGDDVRRLCKIEQPQRADRAVLEAISSPALGRLAAAATGAREFVQAWWVQLLIKPPESAAQNTQVGWHQDESYWSGWEQGSELFTAWLALDVVAEDSGPMVFVPGSQRWGLRPGGDFYGQDLEALQEKLTTGAGGGGGTDAWRELPVCLPAGGFSLHHRLLIHGSRTNRSSRDRLGLAIHLRTERSQPKDGAWEARYLDDPTTCPKIWKAS